MRLVFAGTPAFAAAALQALHAARHDIALVLTQPDRPAGRGLQTTASPVKRLALELGLAVEQPRTLRDPAIVQRLAVLEPDAMVVAAYGLILPREVLQVPRLGCINIHASLLPRWRGAAPIQRALLAGDAQTGVSIMQMEEGLDTGAVLMREAIEIGEEDTAGTLHERLAALGATSIVRALEGPLVPEPQNDALATYAAKIDREEARIDWRQPAALNARKVRAFDPVPGAWTTYRASPLKIWRARPTGSESAAEAGTVLLAGGAQLVVACGEGALAIETLQRAGGKRVSAQAFLAGSPLERGERLGG